MFESLAIRAADGVEIALYRTLPAGRPKGMVQIAHGASEHARRYERLAGVLAEAGYGVYANDHRGHGRTAGSLDRFGIAGPDGWTRIVADAKLLTDHIATSHPGPPIALLGHSMGSLIAQSYLQSNPERLRAVVLSGTLSALPPLPSGGDLAALVDAAIARHGRDAPSEEFGMLFAGFNEPFAANAPAGGPTGFEWLSRDPAEVQRYVDDPWCGLPLTSGFVADNLRGLAGIWEPGSEQRIPTRVPVLFIAGDQDPVGESGEGVRRLAERYRRAGIAVTERLYPGGRHEMFNEINRDEVHRDLLAWLDRAVA